MSDNPTPATPDPTADPAAAAVAAHDLRAAAVKRLKEKRDLQAHALAYVLVNAFIIAIWAVTTWPGFFWPIFVILGWGIGLAFNVWDVYSPGPSENRIEAEMRRLRER